MDDSIVRHLESRSTERQQQRAWLLMWGGALMFLVLLALAAVTALYSASVVETAIMAVGAFGWLLASVYAAKLLRAADPRRATTGWIFGDERGDQRV